MNTASHTMSLLILLFGLNSYSQVENLDLANLSSNECQYLDSLLISNPSISIDKRIEYYKAIEKSNETRGNYFLALNTLDSLISIYQTQEMTTELADSWRLKSLLHDYTGQYSQAMEASQKGLDLYKQLQNNEGIAYSYNDIGVLNYYIGDQESARTYFNQAHLIFIETNDEAGIAMYNNNVANTFFEEGDYNKAVELYTLGYDYDLKVGDLYGQSITLSNLAETYLELKDLSKAEELGIKALSIAEGLDDKWAMTNPLFVMARIFYRNKDYYKAVDMLERNIEVCLELNAYPELFESYEFICEILASNGSFESAYNYQVKWKNLADSIYAVEKNKIEEELQIKGIMHENALEIELDKTKKELDQLREAELSNKEDNNLVFYLMLALILAICGLVYSLIKSRKLSK